MFGNCNHCCFCCGHPCTMLGVSLFISCKNKIQCVCVGKKKKVNQALEKFLLKTNCIYKEFSLGKSMPVTWSPLTYFSSYKTIISDFHDLNGYNLHHKFH